jgi:hypothetical protein
MSIWAGERDFGLFEIEDEVLISMLLSDTRAGLYHAINSGSFI